jgi:hypothetical protein
MLRFAVDYNTSGLEDALEVSEIFAYENDNTPEQYHWVPGNSNVVCGDGMNVI